MLVTALDSTSDTVDALVGLSVIEALEGLLGNVVLLLEEVVISVFQPIEDRGQQEILNSIHHPSYRAQLAHIHSYARRGGEIRVPETHLAVAGGVHVPGGGGLEDLVEPRPADNEGGERVLHCCGFELGGSGCNCPSSSSSSSSSRRECAKWGWAEQLQNFWESSERHVMADDHSWPFLWLAFRSARRDRGA